MYYTDYHVHSTNSFDGKSTMKEICKSAYKKGIKEICFTEHFSIESYIPTYGYLNFENYFSELDNCRELFGDLIIKSGLEICEPHLSIEKLKNSLQGEKIDFILGSVHNINKLKLKKYIENRSNYEAYNGYFEEIYNLVCNADIDVLAHMDLLKRYAFDDLGNYNFVNHKNLIQEILVKLINRNIGIEINTSGVRSNVNEAFPCQEIIELYKSLGGEIITIGSDSHDNKLVGEGFDLAVDMLKSCGFNYIFTFEKRKAIAVRI